MFGSFCLVRKEVRWLAAKKNPLCDKAYEMYKGGMKLVDIASKLNLPNGTIRRWKSTYKWDSERSDSKSERSEKKKAKICDGTKETLQNTDLTPEEQMFCIYYSRTFNATQSYLNAFQCSYNTANAEGYKLLVKPCVKEEIDKLKERKRRQIIADEHDIVELQMRIAFSDMENYVSFHDNNVMLKESVSTDTQLIKKVSKGKNGISVEIEDRQKAIDWLTKYFLLHPDDKYKAEFNKKRAEVGDNSAEKILQNMQTIADILQHPVENRSIENFEDTENDE